MSVWIVDLDGTCALNNGRGYYEYDRVGEDLPNEPVCALVGALHHYGYDIVFVTGREDSCRAATVDWIEEHILLTFDLFMRPTGDRRPDTVVKKEIYDQHLKDMTITGVLEDRPRVVQMWRDLGLMCLQAEWKD
jgi:hypothetical protein